MFDTWLEEFSRKRLGGWPVPEDVRLLAQAQWEGRKHPFQEYYGVTIMEPYAQHPLTDISYLSERELADPDIMANVAARAQMAEHFKVVAIDDEDCPFGYWLPPEQRSSPEPPPIYWLDSEGTYWPLGTLTFSEACLYEKTDVEFEMFVDIAAELAQMDIRISLDCLQPLDFPVEPDLDEVQEQMYRAERRKRGLE